MSGVLVDDWDVPDEVGSKGRQLNMQALKQEDRNLVDFLSVFGQNVQYTIMSNKTWHFVSSILPSATFSCKSLRNHLLTVCVCVCVYVHIHWPLHYESSGRMDKCDIMTGRKCDRVARQSVKWIHIQIEISWHRTLHSQSAYCFFFFCSSVSSLCSITPCILAIVLTIGRAIKASLNGTELSASKQKERLKLGFLSCCQGNTSAAYHPARGIYSQIFGLDQCEDLKRYHPPPPKKRQQILSVREEKWKEDI